MTDREEKTGFGGMVQRAAEDYRANRPDEVGDIVQIAPDSDLGLDHCLLVVEEVTDWGVRAYFAWPFGWPTPLVHYRLARGKYRWTGGKAVWMSA